MTRAYDPLYLDQAMRTMGSMLDTAVLDLQMDLSVFYGLFLSTGVADRFASGEANLLAGKSVNYAEKGFRGIRDYQKLINRANKEDEL